MNKEIIAAICDRLEAEVEALRWIDIDSGQLEVTQRPAVAFPACLVDMAYPQCDDLGGGAQTVTANVTLRLVFDSPGQTNAASPVRETSLAFLDTLEAVHAALQGWSTTALSAFSRLNAQPEKNKSGLKVYRITYQTAFTESV